MGGVNQLELNNLLGNMFNGSGGNPLGNMNNNGAMGNIIGNLLNSEEGMNLIGGMLKGGGSNGIILIVLALLFLGFGNGFNQIGNKGTGCNCRTRYRHHHKHHKRRCCSSEQCNMS
ncbi:MAG: hypothetical protein K0R54_366 [Clostridiaceae bacterium]|jgi:hypothetical protein|nr:hypothetical protein [Clostridiaceae bacterium]